MWQEQLVFSLANNTTLTVTNANIWQGSLTVEKSVSTDGMFEIGSTHIGQMSVSLFNSTENVLENANFSLSNEGHLLLEGEPVSYDVVYDNVDFLDAVVVVSMAKDSDTLQQIGVYNVVTVERDNGIITITAYDNMNLLSAPYTTSLSFPSTYGAMVQEITGRAIQFDGSTTAVQSAPEMEPDTTKREVLGYIAQACGYNVMCNASGYIEFARYNMSGFNTSGSYHEISSLFEFHHSHYPVVITGAKVVVKTIVTTTDSDTGETTSEEVTSTYTSGTDDYQIVIENNPLITTANGQTVADTIFATFGGVEFYTGSVSHLSDLSIKASDIMKVTDRTGTTYPMLVSSTQISTGSPQLSQSFAEEPASKLSAQPSLLDRVQTSIRQALLDAKNAQNKGNYAAQIAGNTNQYFWHTETGSDTGAHITEIPQEDFLADPTNGGGNLLARSNGVAVRNGLTELAQFVSNGVKLYDGVHSSPSAQFRSDKAIIGREGFSNVEISENGVEALGDTNNIYFKVSKSDTSASYPKLDQYVSDLEVGAVNYNVVHDKTEDDEYPNITLYIMLAPKDQDPPVYYVLVRDSAYIWGTSRSKTYVETYDNQEYSFSVQYNADNDSFVTTVTSCPSGVSFYLYTEARWVVTGTAPSYQFGEVEDGVVLGEYAFAEGWQTQATGKYSHSAGIETEASGYASHAHGAGTIASGQSQTAIGAWNVEDTDDEYALIIGNGHGDDNRSNALTVDWDGRLSVAAVKSYTPTFESGQEPANYHCVVSAGICSLFYQGQGVAHPANTVLFTLPVGARPVSSVLVPFVKMTGGAVGVIGIATDGTVKVNQITNTSSTGRIYFNCSFPVV